MDEAAIKRNKMKKRGRYEICIRIKGEEKGRP